MDITSIVDPIYDIIFSFFPTALLEIPFFAFLLNLFIFIYCCWIFSIFFLYPIKGAFNWIRSKIING